MRNWPGIFGRLLRTASRVLFKSPEDGCQTIVFCAVANGLKKFSGRLFAECEACPILDSMRDKETCQKLWDLSLELCGLEKEHKYEIFDTAQEENKQDESETAHTKSQ